MADTKEQIMKLWFCKKKDTKKYFIACDCFIVFDRFLIGADWNFKKELIDFDIELGFLSFGFIMYKKQEVKNDKSTTRKRRAAGNSVRKTKTTKN